MKKTVLSLVLALLMVLPMLASCSSGNSGTQTSDSTTAPQIDPATQAIDDYVAGIAENVNFSGETFTYIGRQSDNFPVEYEETGNLLSDAVYKRQRELEDIFGIKWEDVVTEHGDDTQQKVIQDVLSSMGAYDLAHGAVLTVGQPLMVNRSIMNVNDFTILDLGQEWWIGSLEETFSINEKLYLLTGTIVAEHYSDAGCVLFNKMVADDFELPDIYELVNNGTWTVDKMFEVASVVPANTSGSGVYRYGFTDHRSVGFDFLFANGMSITSFDDNGTPSIPGSLPVELSNFADKMSVVLGDETIVCTGRVTNAGGEDVSEKYGVEELTDLFVDGEVLFWFDGTSVVTSLREKDVEFGIVPYPKGEESMEYRTYAQSGMGSAVYVPKTVKDVSKVDAIVEAMAALSQKHVKPAFYDKMLKGRSTYDTDSREMIDIIFSTKTYDLVDIFSGGDMNTRGDYINLIDRAIKHDSSSIASNYMSTAKLTSIKIRRLVSDIAKDQ